MRDSPASSQPRQSPRFARLAFLFLMDSLTDTCVVCGKLRDGDLASAQALGHRLKGSGGTFGYPHLSDLGACLQSLAAAGHDEASSGLVKLIANRLRDLIAHTESPVDYSIPVGFGEGDYLGHA